MKIFFHKLFFTIWPATIWSAIIFILLTIPGSGLPEQDIFNIPNLDKVLHAILFFVFTWLWAKSIHKDKPNINFKKQIIFIAVIATLYGIALEYVQLFVDRDFDVWDMVADGAGAFACVLFYKKLAPVKTGAATKTNCL